MDNAPLIFQYLSAMGEHNAADMYLTVGLPPMLRGDKDLIKLSDEVLTPDSVEEILNSMLTSRQRRDFDAQNELNTALDMGGHAPASVSGSGYSADRF